MNRPPPQLPPPSLPPAVKMPAGELPKPRPGPAPLPPPVQPGRLATRGERWAMVIGTLAALLLATWMFSAILTPFVLAGCIAYFLDPPTTRLARIGVPRPVAAFLLVLGLTALALLALLLLYPLLVAQIGVLVLRMPAYVAGIGQAVRQALEAAQNALGPEVVDAQLRDLVIGQAGQIVTFLGSAVARLIGGGVALFNVFALLVVTPVVGFYLLRDWQRMMSRIESWLPRKSAQTLRQLARDTDRVLSAWLRGQLLCCGILAAYYAAALSALGLELGLTVGLMAGLLSFIPYVGSLTGFVMAVVLAVAQFGTWNEVLLVVGVFLVGHIVEGYIIYPRLLGDRVELHAVWVIFALFAGGVAFGFLGVLLAVPMAAAIGVIARYWLRRYLESPLYLDPPRTGSG
ncbi:AI-2E family transporter [Falsiroseomonas sp.]|uniref:AI-2E family transporter n=1 Tax=Falsiroseomonas sp. TaxID=2870721 RepID=UPI0027178EFF|nr:AI-2E family transporter [Falsiroseomonas sp.]MDO9500430.1 AI-2E family transporter [Falsiroseomonas sp.]